MNRLTGIFKMPVNHDGMARRGELSWLDTPAR